MSVNASNNRLSASDGYQFDTAGNTIRDPQNRKFTYDAENKQTKVETVDANGNVTGTIGQYSYDGDGRRVKKIAYANNQPTETTVFIYDASSRLVAEYSTILNPTPQVAYLTNDHLGSPRINTDETGKVTARHDYRPTAKKSRNERTPNTPEIRSVNNSPDTNATGDRFDFAQARYYSQIQGRFLDGGPFEEKYKSDGSTVVASFRIHIEQSVEIHRREWKVANGNPQQDSRKSSESHKSRHH
ncbi:MAG: hypothetical protein IPJ30_02465 [Acidobacteria bacterium]|nr:hypothetical protein [Acidobacteriota bacterium]